ncbi:MAG: RNA methyltransferase [Oscillospiraceae bacterium]|nr:RNA methyltransferase [Oscillospiraceae bacterium]
MAQINEIKSLSESPWQEWLSCSETQLFHYYEPSPGLFIAESPNVIARAMAAGYKPESFLIGRSQYGEQVKALLPEDFQSVYLADDAVLNTIPGIHLTRGVLCAMRRKPVGFDPVSLQNMKRIAVLENIMNPTNLGAIFRSAAALGVDAVLLTQGCTDPLYRRAARVSMGTVFQIPWAYLPDAPDAADGIRMLREAGFSTAAMALCDDSFNIDAPQIKAEPRLAIALGTEGEGLSNATISACDRTVRIPMLHGVDSLNVAAASAVAFWELRAQQ